MSLRRFRKRAIAMVVTMIAAVVLPLAAQAPAQAAPDVVAGPTAWTPGISPLFTAQGEYVTRNVSSADRNAALVTCSLASGIACVSVGQGDGRHSVFHLFRCETRSLSNFINALAVRNHQTGGAQVHFWGPGFDVKIPANQRIYTVDDAATYNFNSLDLC